MVKPREARPRPVPLTPEEAAGIEAKYEALFAFVARLKAHREAWVRDRRDDGAPAQPAQPAASSAATSAR